MEGDKRDLERQVNELKAKCDAIEKREAERRAVEEKKHAEEIQFLKRTNQQLKVPYSLDYLIPFNNTSNVVIHVLIPVTDLNIFSHSSIKVGEFSKKEGLG